MCCSKVWLWHLIPSALPREVESFACSILGAVHVPRALPWAGECSLPGWGLELPVLTTAAGCTRPPSSVLL